MSVAQLTIVNALGQAAGKYVAATPVLSASGSSLYLEQRDLLPVTAGTALLTVPDGIPVQYAILDGREQAYAAAQASLLINRDIGDVVLEAAGRTPLASQRLTTVTGNLYDLFGRAADRLRLRVSQIAVDARGVFVIPEAVPIPNVNGQINLALAPTADLYAASGALRYEIVRDLTGYPVVGQSGFTVPVHQTGETHRLAVVNGSVVIVTS